MPRHKHTILVVDDEPDVVQSVQDLLRLDYRVLGATRAEDGMKLLGEHEVDVIMTDQRMPGMTGVEFLSRVRNQYPEAIRLLFTGYADIKAVIDSINQGSVYRYITKPWDPDELQMLIRQATEQYDLLVERRRLLAELQVKNAELQKSNDLKEAFIRVASHELRTPLTIMLGLTELAVLTPGLTDPLLDWLNHIYKAGQRLHHLMNQLIQMLTAGRFERPLDRKETDLKKLLEEAAEEVRPFVERRKQQLHFEVKPDLGTLSIDGGKIRDGVEHLLLNAIKFTPDGGTIRLAGSRTQTGWVEIRVSDTGQGIDPNCLPHIFDPFFTEFDVSRHSSGHFEYGRRGLGLGLTLVKAFVDMHGGKVEPTSEPGCGSTFVIRLPPDVNPRGNGDARDAYHI